MRPLDTARPAGQTMRLRDPSNSYKCYDSITTPSPISNGKGYQNNDDDLPMNNNETLHRSTSLDSLANSSDQDSESAEVQNIINDELISDTDSITDLGHITGTTCAQIHRKSDLEELKDALPVREPIIKAYLEKSHRKCDYKNCGFKNSDPLQQNHQPVVIYNDDIKEEPITIQSQSSTPSLNGSITSMSSLSKNRRNSIASSGSVGRMETIIEEPIEPKVSVKEILARFETLRESAEVGFYFYFRFCCISMVDIK